MCAGEEVGDILLLPSTLLHLLHRSDDPWMGRLVQHWVPHHLRPLRRYLHLHSLPVITPLLLEDLLQNPHRAHLHHPG